MNRHPTVLLSSIALLLSGVFGAQVAPQTALVVVPVADVWSRPPDDGEISTDDRRETQVLYGERVVIHKSSGIWDKIEAIEQPEFTHKSRWEGYPGWVLRKSLGYRRVSPEELEIGAVPPVEDVIQFSEKTLGTPYLWGGLSQSAGLDCSGLVHLAYRKHRKVIPRDSHEQWMKAKKVAGPQLLPADLIFSAKADDPKKVTHVALYAGDGQIIEAPQTGMVVRKISFKEKYGKDLTQVRSGDRVGDRVIYFGSFLR